MTEENARAVLKYLKGQEPDAEDSEELDMEAGKYDPPPLHYCHKCNVVQGYRTRHCRTCDMCVAKFDHHCFWIGSCVGELNHRKFWGMLLVMSLEYIVAFHYVS